MEAFANLVKNKESCTKRIAVRKIYIDEDPNQEDEFPCPKCWEQQRQSVVRYMYVNFHEAIFKCQSASCMYPFRDFKYKNYTDKTVYFYRALESNNTEPVADKTNPAFPNLSSPSRTANSASSEIKNSSPVIDFGTSFFTPEKEKCSGSQEPNSSKDSLDLDCSNIFDSPSLSFKNLAKEFDTGFIDDILLELGGPQSPEKSPLLRDMVRTVSPVKPATTNRQLKRCLEMFHKSKLGGPQSPEKKPLLRDMVRTVSPVKPATTHRQLKRCLEMFHKSKVCDSKNGSIFKVPPVPGAEIPVSPKHKPKKSSHKTTRHKQARRLLGVNADHGPVSKILQKSRIRPLEFIESLNNMQSSQQVTAGSNETEGRSPHLPGIKPLGNQKVERMLNFIERSMRNRKSPVKPPPTNFFTTNMRATAPRRKESRKLSLSAAVLQDTQFQYSTSEDEECSSEASTVSTAELEQVDQKPLPSFDDLLHIVQSSSTSVQAQPKLLSPNGFRSAGSSPKHAQQWDHTPPRRIHSMESLSSLLE